MTTPGSLTPRSPPTKEKETASGFWLRANAFFKGHGITVIRVLTDNGACYATTYLSDEARAATYQQWVHNYSHYRPHTGIGGKSPIERAHNVPGNYS